jgi:2-hydroxymuconate-semialdehyde hydrolase
MAEHAAVQRFRTSSGEIAYLDAGPDGDADAPAVVLLHGFPTSSLLWKDVAPDLERSFRVITPDLLGYGASEQPSGAPLDMPAQARSVRELLEGLGIERFAVVGHDIGGAVAQLLALEGGADVLCLLDTDAFDRWPIEGLVMLQAAEPEQEEPGFVGDVIDLTLDLGTTRKDVLTPELLSAFREPFTRDQAAAEAFFRAARGIDGVGLAGRDDELAALDLPSLIIWGEDDPYVEVDIADRLVEVLARPALVTLPDVGHFTPLEAPDVVAPLLEQFLSTHLLGRSHAHGPEHAHGPHGNGGQVMIPLERHGPA